ncbi:MAG TPA: lamin tail domain-containing protein, partial [Candidatus Paceibacterota bacterium]|nr:lamin tail domain-containing protein [Candidatus Paceibacterota bacterium]
RGLGQPWMYRRFVALYVNGARRSKFMEDACRPTPGLVSDQYLNGDSGQQLVKIQRWYEGSSYSLISECLLRNFSTADGSKKTARYRPNWALKDSPGSLSDYTNIYTLITAANAYNDSNYINILENVADMENWMRFSAANHAAGNWDCFGSTGSGQNAHAWVSAQHPWTLFQVDFSICLDNRLSGANLSGMYDGTWRRMLATPKFGRMYYRALNELANGVMRSDVINPVLDAKYAAFLAAGQNPSSPANTKSWIASRRSTILSTLAGINTNTFAIGTNLFSATSNTVTLNGTAPVEIVTINIDGINYTPVWTTLTNWSLTVPAAFGTNTWTVQAFDRYGNVVGGSFPVSVENPDMPESPVGNVVFNEIMFNPATPGAEYLELFNRATNTTFDLSGWTINGLGYTFPPGSVLQPQRYLVLAKSSVVFAATYGALIPVFGTFDGSLQSDGETLSLIKPGTAPELDVVVNRVRYEPNAPWPASPAFVPGTSLQLVDANQDNSRVANWNSNDFVPNTPGSANSVAGTLPEFPALWLNEVQVENLTGPMDNFDQREPWVELYNSGTNVINLNGFYLGTNYLNPMQWTFPAEATIAPGQFLVIWLDGQPEQNSGAVLHTDFRLGADTSTLALSRFVDGSPQIVDYLNFASLPANHSYGDIPDGQQFYRQAMFHPTPAGTNNAALPAITVSINEWMAQNDGYLFNPGTEKNNDDWFELYNPSGTPAELGGYYLTDNLTNAFQFQIPSGYRVPANGFLLVWADGKSSANSTNNPDLHVPFKLDKGGEAIGLFSPDGVAIDAVSFGAQTANISEGRFPDGQALRLLMPTPSLLLPNVLPPALAPPSFIGFSHQAGQLGITFHTSPGHTYRVEFKNDLSDPTWSPLGSDHFATEASLSVSDGISGPQRFYRVRMVE